jgi:hypothetical protein
MGESIGLVEAFAASKQGMFFTTALLHCLVLFIAIKVMLFGYTYWIRPSKLSTKLGEWAVVTGCTDGIGKAYAFALAEKGREYCQDACE